MMKLDTSGEISSCECSMKLDGLQLIPISKIATGNGTASSRKTPEILLGIIGLEKHGVEKFYSPLASQEEFSSK